MTGPAARGGSTRGRETVATLVTEHARFEAFLRRRLRSREAAEDVLQSTYLRILARDEAPSDRARVTSWFFRVLTRAVLDRARAETSDRRRIARRAADATVGATAAERELRSVVCECVTSLVDGLPAVQRDLLRRVELDGDSPAEAARRLGITPGTASVRLHRARKALADRLRDVCGACTAHGCLRCTCSRGSPPPV